MGEGLAFDAVWLFAALLVLIVVAAAALATRRYWLERGGGTVECGLRSPSGRGAWRLGVISYQRGELRWHGALGVALRPEHVFPRRAVEVTSRRPVDPAETAVLDPGWIIVEAKTGTGDDPVELAMSDQALTGLLAWLEAAPPGSHLDLPGRRRAATPDVTAGNHQRVSTWRGSGEDAWGPGAKRRTPTGRA